MPLRQRQQPENWPKIIGLTPLEKRRRRRFQRIAIETILLVASVIGLTVAIMSHKLPFPIRIEEWGLGAAVIVAGWLLSRGLSSLITKTFPRLDPTTSGTLRFILRLVIIGFSVVMGLSIAGFTAKTLGLGVAITAVVAGLAAQQTLGNVLAGLVLLSARPFRVGDRVKLQAGGLAGDTEGVVHSLGLIYTTLERGRDLVMVPNNVVLSAAVIPLKEPASIDLRARLRPDVRPRDVQTMLEEAIKTPVRNDPHIELEEVHSNEIVVRVAATPVSAADGGQLADEILTAMASMTRDDEPGPMAQPFKEPMTPLPDPVTQEFES